MKALITGASSGIGKDIAIILSNMGYDLVLVSRENKGYESYIQNLKTKYTIYEYDLSKRENAIELYNKEKNIDILVNNAGFGTFGEFVETDLDKEISMIDTNVLAVHILTKLYLKDMVKRDEGHILNVSSIAGFMPAGPLMATYYSTKNYVLSLTKAINRELLKKHSNVKMSVLCPGPTNTKFNDLANVSFKTKAMESKEVASYAVRKMFKGKCVIVPGAYNRLYIRLAKFAPSPITENILYRMQILKQDK